MWHGETHVIETYEPNNTIPKASSTELMMGKAKRASSCESMSGGAIRADETCSWEPRSSLPESNTSHKTREEKDHARCRALPMSL